MLSGVVLLFSAHAVVRALAPARATATARHASVHAQSEPAAAAREPIAYYRDPDDAYFEKLAKLPPVDEAAVDALVAERSRLRAAFEYDAADAVKAQILALGVTVVDVRGQEAWYVTPRHSRTLEAAEAAEVEEGRAASASPRRKGGRDLGPRGHDFERAGGGAKGKAGQVSLGEVGRRLHDPRSADRIRDQPGSLEIGGPAARGASRRQAARQVLRRRRGARGARESPRVAESCAFGASRRPDPSTASLRGVPSRRGVVWTGARGAGHTSVRRDQAVARGRRGVWQRLRAHSRRRRRGRAGARP